MSFTDVVTGNPTNASDLNQLVDALNGSVQSELVIYATSSSAVAIVGKSPGAPSSDQDIVRVYVTGDSDSRIGLAIGGSSRSHYGGIVGGVGSAYTAHMFATSDGFLFDEDIHGLSGGGIPMTRNGTAVSVPMYSGSGTPTLPPTGAVWLNQ